MFIISSLLHARQCILRLLHRRSLPWPPSSIYPPTSLNFQFGSPVDFSNLTCLGKNFWPPSTNPSASPKFEMKTAHLFFFHPTRLLLMASSSTQLVKLQTYSHYNITFIKILNSFLLYHSPVLTPSTSFHPNHLMPDSHHLPLDVLKKSLTRTPYFLFKMCVRSFLSPHYT